MKEFMNKVLARPFAVAIVLAAVTTGTVKIVKAVKKSKANNE